MKYFFDTEFIEGFHRPLFGKRRHFIDLISIGIVCEDGREYYGVSTDFNPNDADEWVKKNVISKLPHRHADHYDSPRIRREAELWKPQSTIARETLEFFGCWRDQHFWRATEGIEVYAYYADYDWVLLCSLFGRMIDLPKGFPMYCRDLKQMMDERGLSDQWKDQHCPKPDNLHSAIEDAKWNMRLYDAVISSPANQTDNL